VGPLPEVGGALLSGFVDATNLWEGLVGGRKEWDSVCVSACWELKGGLARGLISYNLIHYRPLLPL
jgi:hypothetical protein